MTPPGSEFGPYGPGNPPPPPPGSPPSKADRKRGRSSTASTPGKGPHKPYRKLNQAQRKKLKQQQEPAENEQNGGRDRNRSPVRGESCSGQVRHRHEPLRKSGRRQPLEDARQVTPDQILDETYGRLSPVMDSGDYYRPTSSETRSRSVARNEWPEDRSWSPHQSVGEQADHASLGHKIWGEHATPPIQESRASHDEG